MTWPASPKTQQNDRRSPGSNPIVSFWSLKISLLNDCTVLVFFIAGILSVAHRAIDHRERIASRRRPAFPYHLCHKNQPDHCKRKRSGVLCRTAGNQNGNADRSVRTSTVLWLFEFTNDNRVSGCDVIRFLNLVSIRYRLARRAGSVQLEIQRTIKHADLSRKR
jgi:hypothetical protein